MSGIFDLIAAAAGQPDPRMQLAHALGQAPGQPGSNAPGPVPGGAPPAAGANPPAPAPPGPGGPAPAGGAPGGPGGAPGGAPPPPPPPSTDPTLAGKPAPQAFSSPSDLGQMYMQLAMRQQASNSFDRSLGLMAASAYPGRRPDVIMQGMSGGQQDPGAMFSNVLQLQQMAQNQQNMQAYRAAVPGILQKAGLDPSYAPLVMANPDILSKIVETQAGVGGNPAWQAQLRAEKSLSAQGKPIPWTPGDPSSYDAWTKANTGQAVTTAKTTADDLVADQHNFTPALSNYDKGIGLVDQFMTPDMQEGAKEFLGTTGQYRPVASMDAKGKAAYALYKQIMATQFSAGTQDFKGAGRITQQELTQDAPSQSTMGQLNQDPSDFFAGVQKYRDQLAQHRGNLFGAAQQTNDPRLSDQDYAKYVAPNLDVTGGARRPNDFSKMSASAADAAYDKLPSGRTFIDVDGVAKKKP